jgi:mRNA interferase RelE/StbE|nr:MAG TPA: Cytotoxic translational repressor [Caudoviricetes sp.]
MYNIIIKKPAKKFIEKLPKNDKQRIMDAIGKLPDGDNIKKLKGHDYIYRLRVGNFRILYTVNDNELIVVVIDAGNRGQIYNRY